MIQILRALLLTEAGCFIFMIGTFGWTGLLDFGAGAFPFFHGLATMKFIRSMGILVGLALLFLPFYTLLYFHQTTRSDVLGFKTPNANQKPEPLRPANPALPGTSGAEDSQVRRSGDVRQKKTFPTITICQTTHVFSIPLAMPTVFFID